MTDEEKRLLLRDLCARLPYGLHCNGICTRFIDSKWKEFNVTGVMTSVVVDKTTTYIVIDDGVHHDNRCSLDTVKPYLRQWDSMTEEEEEKWESLKKDVGCCGISMFCDTAESFDWLNKNMFDHRGLIPMELALPATEGMYKEGSEKQNRQ